MIHPATTVKNATSAARASASVTLIIVLAVMRNWKRGTS